MIIAGYQGIGKSTIAKKDIKYIDLESSAFRVNSIKPPEWYKVYGSLALDLSKQGYIVFTAFYDPFIRYVVENNESHESIVICYPSLELKDQWIGKLEKRSKETGLDKDYAAYMNAKNMYDQNINEMSTVVYDFGLDECVITDINYDLETVLGEWLGANDPVVYDDFDDVPLAGETSGD